MIDRQKDRKTERQKDRKIENVLTKNSETCKSVRLQKSLYKN